MWFRGVDFPEEVIDAHRDGNLVLFVGAGASVDPPSRLPLFKQLTEGVFGDAGQPMPAGDQYDQHLGRLDDGPVDVHLLVRQRIAVRRRANAVHEAIAALVGSGASRRVVTTNYDRHLSSALRHHGVSLPEYRGPALPPGDDWRGIVYLHGTVLQEPRHLVVTDEDFGRAYLSDAWATRFLERMFLEFPVLFIGYSHTDLVINYLARGMGRRRKQKRFALVPQSDESDRRWDAIDVKAFGYEVHEGSHRALPEAVARWAEIAGMGYLDHEARVRSLLGQPPTRIPEDDAYLESVVGDPELVGLFTEHAAGPEWLSWMSRLPALKGALASGDHGDPVAMTLCSWFVEKFVVVDERLSADALRVFLAGGGAVGTVLESVLATWLQRRAPLPRWLVLWATVLMRPPRGSGWPDYFRLPSGAGGHHLDLWLFDRLLTPHGVVVEPFSTEGAFKVEIGYPGDVHTARAAWTERLKPHLDSLADDLLSTVGHHLQHAHNIVAACGDGSRIWGLLGGRRSAIEPHAQDRYTDDHTALLVDVARDSLDALLRTAPEDANGTMASWSRSDVALLRRLAVYGWTRRTDVTGSGKLQWLHGKGWLGEPTLHHEVFMLVANAAPGADAESTNQLIEDAVAIRDASRSPARDHRLHDTLSWVLKYAPDIESARSHLGALRSENGFPEPEHPEFLTWFEVGVGPEPVVPMSSEDFAELAQRDPQEALRLVESYRGVDDMWSTNPTWDSMLGLARAAVATEPQAGLALIDVCSDQHAEVVRAVLSGLGRATLDQELVAPMVSSLTKLDRQEHAADLARLLSGLGGAGTTQWHASPDARALARDLWPHVAHRRQAEPDAVVGALNEPAAQLAEFWIKAITHDGRAAGSSWTGASAAQLEALNDMVDAETGDIAAQSVLAMYLGLMVDAAELWTTTKLLPLFIWDGDDHDPWVLWESFLQYGRPGERLINAGMLGHYLDAAAHTAGLSERGTHGLAVHLAQVATHADLPPTWLAELTYAASEELRVQWIHQVGQILVDQGAAASDAQWHGWMGRYWTSRLKGKPLPLADAEADAITAWVLGLDGAAEDALGLAERSTPAIAEPSTFLETLHRADELRCPNRLAALISTRLARNPAPSRHRPRFAECWLLVDASTKLREAGANAESLRALAAQAQRLGCGNLDG